MAKTNYFKEADFQNEIAVVKEALALATKFQNDNLFKVKMEVSIENYGITISFTRDAPHANHHCDMRYFNFWYYHDLKELKSSLNKLKRFLKSKCVYEFHYGIPKD